MDSHVHALVKDFHGGRLHEDDFQRAEFSVIKFQSIARVFLCRTRILKAISGRYEKIFDPNRKQHYYYDKENDTTSWSKPALLLKGDLTEVSSFYSPDEVATLIQTRWRMAQSLLRVRLFYQSVVVATLDEDSGYTYYYNPYTGNTTWELPQFMNNRLDYAEESEAALRRREDEKERNRKEKRRKHREGDESSAVDTATGDSETEKYTDVEGGEREEDKEGDGDSSDSEESGMSDDSEKIREKRKKRRKYPRSKAQALVDAAEDNIQEATHLVLSRLQALRFTSRIYDLTNLTHLNLSHNRLQRVSPDIQFLNQLTYFNVSYNRIVELPQEMEELVELAEFVAGHNLLSTFPAHIYKLKTFTALDLSANKFEELPLEVGNLELLKELDQWEVGIGMLTNLTSLNVSRNLLAVWPAQMENLRSLKVLDMSHNLLEVVPPVLTSHSELKYLDLSNNLLHTIPIEIFELPLERLFLQANRLTDLAECTNPSEFGMKFLQETDFSHNLLKALDDRVGMLLKAETVNFCHNQIATLSDSISRLRDLTSLDLSHNCLTGLPDGIGQCKALKVLDISHNRMSELPMSLITNMKLIHLNASYNALVEASGKIFSMLNLLEKLELQHNELNNLSILIYTLKKLTHLDVSHNKISFLHENFGNMVSLTRCDLSHNQIVEIPDSISQLADLRVLELEKNCLSDLPLSMSALQLLSRVSLSQNNLERSPACLALLPSLISWNLSWNLRLQGAHPDLNSLLNKYKEDSDLASMGMLRRKLRLAQESFSKAIEHTAVARRTEPSLFNLPISGATASSATTAAGVFLSPRGGVDGGGGGGGSSSGNIREDKGNLLREQSSRVGAGLLMGDHSAEDDDDLGSIGSGGGGGVGGLTAKSGKGKTHTLKSAKLKKKGSEGKVLSDGNSMLSTKSASVKKMEKKQQRIQQTTKEIFRWHNSLRDHFVGSVSIFADPYQYTRRVDRSKREKESMFSGFKNSMGDQHRHSVIKEGEGEEEDYGDGGDYSNNKGGKEGPSAAAGRHSKDSGATRRSSGAASLLNRVAHLHLLPHTEEAGGAALAANVAGRVGGGIFGGRKRGTAAAGSAPTLQHQVSTASSLGSSYKSAAGSDGAAGSPGNSSNFQLWKTAFLRRKAKANAASAAGTGGSVAGRSEGVDRFGSGGNDEDEDENDDDDADSILQGGLSELHLVAMREKEALRCKHELKTLLHDRTSLARGRQRDPHAIEQFIVRSVAACPDISIVESVSLGWEYQESIHLFQRLAHEVSIVVLVQEYRWVQANLQLYSDYLTLEDGEELEEHVEVQVDGSAGIGLAKVGGGGGAPHSRAGSVAGRNTVATGRSMFSIADLGRSRSMSVADTSYKRTAASFFPVQQQLLQQTQQAAMLSRSSTIATNIMQQQKDGGGGGDSDKGQSAKFTTSGLSSRGASRKQQAELLKAKTERDFLLRQLSGSGLIDMAFGGIGSNGAAAVVGPDGASVHSGKTSINTRFKKTNLVDFRKIPFILRLSRANLTDYDRPEILELYEIVLGCYIGLGKALVRRAEAFRDAMRSIEKRGRLPSCLNIAHRRSPTSSCSSSRRTDPARGGASHGNDSARGSAAAPAAAAGSPLEGRQKEREKDKGRVSSAKGRRQQRRPASAVHSPGRETNGSSSNDHRLDCGDYLDLVSDLYEELVVKISTRLATAAKKGIFKEKSNRVNAIMDSFHHTPPSTALGAKGGGGGGSGGEEEGEGGSERESGSEAAENGGKSQDPSSSRPGTSEEDFKQKKNNNKNAISKGTKKSKRVGAVVASLGGESDMSDGGDTGTEADDADAASNSASIGEAPAGRPGQTGQAAGRLGVGSGADDATVGSAANSILSSATAPAQQSKLIDRLPVLESELQLLDPIPRSTARATVQYLDQHRILTLYWASKSFDSAAELLDLLGWNPLSDCAPSEEEWGELEKQGEERGEGEDPRGGGSGDSEPGSARGGGAVSPTTVSVVAAVMENASAGSESHSIITHHREQGKIHLQGNKVSGRDTYIVSGKGWNAENNNNNNNKNNNKKSSKEKPQRVQAGPGWLREYALQLFRWRALCYQYLGLYPQAIRQYQGLRVLMKHIRERSITLQMAKVSIAQGDFKVAKEYLLDVIQPLLPLEYEDLDDPDPVDLVEIDLELMLLLLCVNEGIAQLNSHGVFSEKHKQVNCVTANGLRTMPQVTAPEVAKGRTLNESRLAQEKVQREMLAKVKEEQAAERKDWKERIYFAKSVARAKIHENLVLTGQVQPSNE